jgi:hypothetical protein
MGQDLRENQLEDGARAYRRNALPRAGAAQDRGRPDHLRQRRRRALRLQPGAHGDCLGYAITRKAIDDNLYKSQFQPSNLGLQESFAQTKEIYGADVLNSGTTYNGTIGGDGVALCATAHPIDGGTFANPGHRHVDLNEASLLNAMIGIRTNFKDLAGSQGVRPRPQADRAAGWSRSPSA